MWRGMIPSGEELLCVVSTYILLTKRKYKGGSPQSNLPGLVWCVWPNTFYHPHREPGGRGWGVLMERVCGLITSRLIVGQIIKHHIYKNHFGLQKIEGSFYTNISNKRSLNTEGLPGGSLFPSKIVLCSHVPTLSQNVFIL